MPLTNLVPLTPSDYDTYGLRPPPAGHGLSFSTTSYGGTALYYQAECECKQALYLGRLKKDGKMGSRAVRQWDAHIAAVQSPDEITPIGRVAKVRVVQEFFVASPNYSGIDQFKTRFHHTVMSGRNYWLVVVRKKYNSSTNVVGDVIERRIVAGYLESRQALQAGVAMINKEGDAGFFTEFFGEADVTPVIAPPIQASTQLTNLLGNADEALSGGDIMQVMNCIEDLSLLLSLTPVVEDRLAALETKLSGLRLT